MICDAGQTAEATDLLSPITERVLSSARALQDAIDKVSMQRGWSSRKTAGVESAGDINADGRCSAPPALEACTSCKKRPNLARVTKLVAS